MLSKRRSLIRSTSIALALAGMVLTSLVVSMVYLVYKTQDFVDGAVKARVVRSAAADLLLALQDAETGQRGFLLTQEQAFLKPYLDSVNEVQTRERALEKAIDASAFVAIGSSFIRDTVNSKLAELRQTLALAQSGRQSEALAAVRGEYGLKLMESIRATLNGVIDVADKRIASQLGNQVDLAIALRIATIAGAVLIACIMVAVVAIMRRYITEILATRSELETLNLGLEQRVKERTEDLIRANQEIQRYAYIVTHDLRAPLVNIMGFTSELQGALDAIRSLFEAEEGSIARDNLRQAAVLAVNEDLPEAIGFIRSSTRKMDELINAILKISRDGRRELRAEPIDLQTLIETSAASIQHQLVEADGVVKISANVRRFVSDRFSVEQIIGNLFDNAVKYRDPARALELSVNAYPVNRFTIAIEVKDNGRGIAEEDHERIFELFRRAGTQNSPGEGIGLAHVRSLTRNMGGDINVKSEIGRGTTFMIRLPSDLSQFVRSSGQ
jgi:signal transduction histidine kinase